MYYALYDALYHELNYLACQWGLLPPLNIDNAGVFSASESLVKVYVKKHKIRAAELKDLIQQVLHHPDLTM